MLFFHSSRSSLLPLMLALPCACAATASTFEPAFTEMGRTIQGYPAAGKARFALGDFDGDDRIDMVVPGYLDSYNTPSGSVLQVAGADASGMRVKQTILLRSAVIARIVAWTPAGERAHLLDIRTDGQATEWAGWPLHAVRTFAVDADVAAAAIGDVDGDGALELVTIQAFDPTRLAVRDLATGQPKWARTNLVDMATDLALEQLDSDPALEIIVAAGDFPGVVVDGATQATEWTHADGFGTYVAVGHFLNGGANGFAGAHAGGPFGVFRANPWTSVWSQPIPLDTDALASADIDGDGRDEVIRADGQWGSLHIHDGLTGSAKGSIPNPANGINAIASVDLTSNGKPAIAFAPKNPWFAEDPLVRLSSPIDGSTIYSIPYLPPPYSPVRVANTGNNGEAQLIHAVRGSYPFMRVVDMQTGQERWRSPDAASPNEPFKEFSPTQIHLAAAPAGAQQLLIVGNVIYSGRIIAVDPVSHAVRWYVDVDGYPPTQTRSILASTLFDFNKDGIEDIVACTSGFSVGAKIQVLSGIDGNELWQSVTIGGTCRDAMAGAFGGVPQVVALVDGALYAFNRDSHLLDWTMNTDGDAAVLLAGVEGPEIAIRKDKSLRFYRAADRQQLRALEFKSPISFVEQLGADIHQLLVATDGTLQLVDGVTGESIATSTYLGELFGRNSFDALSMGAGTFLVGVGNSTGIFRFHLALTDAVFSDGFEQSE